MEKKPVKPSKISKKLLSMDKKFQFPLFVAFSFASVASSYMAIQETEKLKERTKELENKLSNSENIEIGYKKHMESFFLAKHPEIAQFLIEGKQESQTQAIPEKTDVQTAKTNVIL
jgi:hypothetical protein